MAFSVLPCIVTVNCSHLHTTEHPAEPSTCIKHGHNAYTVCDDCGEITEGSDAELPLGEHTGGTATCVKKAVCDVCHQEYGILPPTTTSKMSRRIILKPMLPVEAKRFIIRAVLCGEKERRNL